VWGFLRKIWFRLRWALFRKRTAVHAYGGKLLKVYLSDEASVAWYDHDYPPLPELEFLRRDGFPWGTRIFDIGAHQCVIAMMLAEAVGPSGSVIALEALPHHAKVGLRNVRANGYHNIEVVHGAGAETSGKIAFTFGDHIHRGERDSDGKIWVESYSIDDLTEHFGAPGIVYIDVEGYECRVLKGAAKTLATNPDCFVEVHVGCGLEAFGDGVVSVLNFFRAERYQLLARSLTEERFSPLKFAHGALADTRTNSRFFLLALHR
jgi:FkbM family methyltransferase